MSREEIEDFYYYKDELIGHGAFAIVYKGRYKKKDVDVAVKAITKKNLVKARNLLTKEIRILKVCFCFKFYCYLFYHLGIIWFET
jgi:serine/threonine protein kinase